MCKLPDARITKINVRIGRIIPEKSVSVITCENSNKGRKMIPAPSNREIEVLNDFGGSALNFLQCNGVYDHGDASINFAPDV